ncbi:ABC transporter permease subunit [Kiloniella sp. b19]|uniref:ABC transporter permease subunit n=1 Tax=Kiloniella sp. GXU_MW_B19 TaxID=3141326 RepID=UPI0031CFD7B5
MAFLRNRKFLDFLLQFAFLGTVIGLIVSAVVIGRENMAAQGLTGGFAFLEQATGWGISFSLVDYSIQDTYSHALKVGILNTLFLGVITLTLATIIGLTAASARLSSNKLLAKMGVSFVEIFRNIPLVLQALFWYAIMSNLPKAKQAISPFEGVFLSNRGAYFPGLNVTGGSAAIAIALFILAVSLAIWIAVARRTSRMQPSRRRMMWVGTVVAGALVSIAVLAAGRIPGTELLSIPYLKGLNFREGIRLTPELMAAIVAISLYGAAFIAEIFRAGLLSIRKGMGEAGAALGLRPYQVFFRIRLPLAIRAVLPTLTNQYVWLMKATTIGIAIGFNDFFMVVAVSINQSGQTLSLILILILGFWALNLSLSAVFNWINRRIALKGTQNR